MANDKNVEVGHEKEDKEEEFGNDTSTRARNRTVMLTPEITGQVRKMLAQEIGGESHSAPSTRATPAAAPLGSSYHAAGQGSSGAGMFREPSHPGVGSGFTTPTSSAFHPVQAAVQPPPQAHQPVKTTARNTPVVGFLVSFDSDQNGEVFELRTGRWIVSSEQTTSGNFIIVLDPTVSPLHAILRVSASGEIQVLDQLSEHGTGVTRSGGGTEEQLTGSMAGLEHGDTVRFGKRVFHVCIIQK